MTEENAKIILQGTTNDFVKSLKQAVFVIDSKAKQTYNLLILQEIAEPVPNKMRNLAPSSLASLGTTPLLVMTFIGFLQSHLY